MATYYSGYSNTYRLILELSETKLSDYISTNKTRVNYTLKCSCGSSYAQWNPGPGDFSISINGSVVKTLNNPSFWFPGTNTTITLASGYTDVNHNSDGSKTVSFSASYKAESTAGYLPGNMSLSGNYALTTIPRATTISSVTSEVYVNGSNSISIALDRKSTNFTQNVTIKANDTYQTTITNSDVNVSYVIPVTWINAIGSNTSISGTVIVTTYNGSTQIGDTQTSTFTLKKATPSTITCTDSIECNGSNILRVGITRQNTAFLHTVNFVFGSYSQSFSSIENLKEYAPPMTWLNAIPNATSGKGTVTVTTYYGSISLGSNSKDFELVVPTSVIPSISSFTSSVVNPSQMSSWGVYVQGYSQAKLTIGASGSYGSTISEWYFDGVSQSSNIKTTEAINQSGTVTFKANVKDSRGRTSSEVPVSINVNEYSTPVLIKNLLKRCLSDETIDDEGTYVLANFTFLYSSCAGKNSISTKIYSREITAESWTDNGTLTSGVNKKISSFDISKPYAIKVVSTDGVGNEATYVDVIETSNAIIDILKGGNGMGLGMMSSKENTLQIGFPYIEVDNGIFYINYTDKTTGKTVKSQIGSQNGSYMHYLTDAENGNYFNKKVTVDNGLIVTGHADIGSEKVNGLLEVDGVSTFYDNVKQGKGSYVHQIWGNATDGYFKFATIVILGDYVNRPINMSIVKRGNIDVSDIGILFDNVNSFDPELSRFVCHGYDVSNFYIHKSTTSTWDLYAIKSDSYDDVVVANYSYNPNNNIKITWKSETVTSLPSGAIQAVNNNILTNTNYKDLTAFTYSTSEQWTGKYDHNGRKIYSMYLGEINVGTSTGTLTKEITFTNVLEDCWVDDSMTYFAIKNGTTWEYRKMNNPTSGTNSQYVSEAWIVKSADGKTATFKYYFGSSRKEHKYVHPYIMYTYQ